MGFNYILMGGNTGDIDCQSVDRSFMTIFFSLSYPYLALYEEKRSTLLLVNNIV